MMAVCITHPIDQTKIRVQTQQVRQGMLAVAAQTIRDSPIGFRGLWVGLTGSLLRQASYGATRFGVYNYLKQRDVAGLGKEKSQGHENLGLVINGALAGVVAGIAGGPAGASSYDFL
jgi:dicarboxylate transporter 10